MIPFFFRMHELIPTSKVITVRKSSVSLRQMREVSIVQLEYCVSPDYPLVHGRDAANEDLRIGPSQLFVAQRLNSPHDNFT